MPRRVGVAGRFKRAQPHDKESDEKSKANARNTQNGKVGVSERNGEESSSSFFGSKHFKSQRLLGDDGRLEYLDLLPPKTLREEEYELNALMVHSR